MSVVMSNISRSTVDCNIEYNVSATNVFVSYKTVLYLTKTFVDELYIAIYCVR